MKHFLKQLSNMKVVLGCWLASLQRARHIPLKYFKSIKYEDSRVMWDAHLSIRFCTVEEW